jgi:hypothetical protein
VRYVLGGSVRRSGSRLRISGQLIDASNGTHLWAEKFDGAIEDIFDLQDKVTESVIGAIEPTLKKAEISRTPPAEGGLIGRIRFSAPSARTAGTSLRHTIIHVPLLNGPTTVPAALI